MLRGCDVMNEPLAISLRPSKLDDVIGQSHLIGKDKILRNLVDNKKIFSMFLYGKPGIGKTTIAMAIVQELNLKHRFLNAVINNKKDFDVVVEEAKMFGGLVVIMDEIHRLNKDKQDLLLPYLESGLITLIGMTTSNPYHKINPAIRSRCQIFELKELTSDDVVYAINKINKEKLFEEILKLKDLYDFLEIVPISGLKGNNTDELVKSIKKHLPDDIKYFEDDTITNTDETFMIGEIIREKVLNLTKEEVPHSVTCLVENIEFKKGVANINALIIVDRKNLKKIIIGKNGSMLKKIGTLARKDIESYLNMKVYLELYVKTIENWKNKEEIFDFLKITEKDL